MPISNSRIDIADRYKVDVETFFAQSLTLGSILLVPAFRSSEMTSVSSRYIRRGASGEICRTVKIATQAGRLKLNLGRLRHRQQFEDVFFLASNFSVFFDGHQHVGGSSAIRDNDRATFGRLLSSARILIEFPAGKSRDCQIALPVNVVTCLHYSALALLLFLNIPRGLIGLKKKGVDRSMVVPTA